LLDRSTATQKLGGLAGYENCKTTPTGRGTLKE